MSEETALATIDTDQIADEQESASFQAVALNATEMQGATAQVRAFLEDKIAEIDTELAEMSAAYQVAKSRKWSSQPLANQVSRIRKRKTYYDKLLGAVNAGYTIVPNMPCDVFVIRTNRATPQARELVSSHQYSVPELADIDPPMLPAGEGHHESPQQRNYVTSFQQPMTDGTQQTRYRRVGVRMYQGIEFPLAVAHPVVMSATDHAMKKLIFDRIGIVPQGTMRRQADPIVLGQIMTKSGYHTKIASFLIAWHLDLRSL